MNSERNQERRETEETEGKTERLPQIRSQKEKRERVKRTTNEFLLERLDVALLKRKSVDPFPTIGRVWITLNVTQQLECNKIRLTTWMSTHYQVRTTKQNNTFRRSNIDSLLTSIKPRNEKDRKTIPTHQLVNLVNEEWFQQKRRFRQKKSAEIGRVSTK